MNAPSARSFAANNYGVLYVDDEEDNLLVFRSNLAEDFAIHTCRSGDEALRILDAEPVSLVLTDQRMPGMTGVDLCQRVRDEHPSVRRLLMTAYADQDTAVDAINRGGVHGFLVKPWEEEHLRRVLTAELERVHLAQEVTRLRGVIAEHQQQLHVASVRARLLHDVANVTLRLNLSFRRLAELLVAAEPEGLRGAGLERAQDSSRRMRTALDHLMALHAEQRELHDQQRPEQLSLREVVECAVALAGLDQTPHIRTHLTGDGGLSAFVDRISLTRILVNLLANAAQAIDGASARGRIQLDQRQEGPFVVLEVADTGPGIPETLRQRIFDERFTTRKDCGGSGLGLSSARALAEANGGSLELIPSEGGACFRLLLPVRPAREHAASLAC